MSKKQPQYIPVKVGNKKKEYVQHAMENCLPESKPLVEMQLKKIITQAKNTDMLNVIDWNERDLPSACIDTKNPNSLSLFHKKPAAIVSKLGNIELTPAEEKRRQLRALRFQNDTATAPPPLKKKKKKSFTPIVWNDNGNDLDQVIIGTSTNLEKPYFRLTSAADPATVRPLNVLKKTYKMLRTKWKTEANYSYICEQFKSMRQDLTVQRIRNEFTVMVYETHARIALEKGDIGEYNQCQTQLKYLYEQDISGCEDEFTAYRILYLIFSQNQSDINAMLEEMCDIGLENHASCVQHALMVRTSLAKGNYHKFFQLYEEAPNMGGYLLDQFVGRVRIDALLVMCKAYKLGVPLSYIAQELSFKSIKKLVQFLREHGIRVIPSKDKSAPLFDTKSALPILMAQSKSYNKVDIKGQI
ncbi:SAC3/GANP/Nin1/mts3/eIF-3 p25 family-domain-containing protein [Choanephora cucurbitarum]|nr:SAC3/GANP/Nin1/mts3/eIF-3 p25 family-domain-containing protein [Choanephora cucurbitarum]